MFKNTVLHLCRERKRFCIFTYFAEVLSVAHRSPVERQNMPGGASLTHKIYLADGAHPGLYRPVHLLLMRNVTLWVREYLRTVEKWAIFHFKEKPSYFVAGARARTINVSGATFPSHQLPTTYKESTIHWIGIEVETVAKKTKKKIN